MEVAVASCTDMRRPRIHLHTRMVACVRAAKSAAGAALQRSVRRVRRKRARETSGGEEEQGHA